MTPKRKRRSKSRAAKEQQQQQQQQHQQLLAELELVDSCCDICHCDCYSSHSSGNASGRDVEQLEQLELKIHELEQLQRSEEKSEKKKCSNKPRSLSRQRSASKSPIDTKTNKKESQRSSSSSRSRRSKSAGSQRSQSRHEQHQPEQKQTTTTQLKQRIKRPTGALRDCQMLQTVFGLDGSSLLTIRGSRAKSKSQENMALVPLGHSEVSQSQLCASMANLCLAPTVRAAYDTVPQHDQKILNRMAVKRSQQAADKEHAWLARKYWENERLERQLLKCEQLEEYKQAVHDKQFQDYMLTKARLQALAERDLAELRRLRGALDAKDAAVKQRLQAMRLERDLTLCQRRHEESRRSEAVSLQQEEQQLDATLRKRDTCMRLTQRLRRADELRTELLEGYLRRLQHDNQVEQLQHEEHWRERQQLERLKREQLQHDIQRKRQHTQRFVDTRQRRHEARFRTAKISASLRELVRQSVTPESALLDPQQPHQSTTSFYAQQQSQLSRLLFKQK